MSDLLKAKKVILKWMHDRDDKKGETLQCVTQGMTQNISQHNADLNEELLREALSNLERVHRVIRSNDRTSIAERRSLQRDLLLFTLLDVLNKGGAKVTITDAADLSGIGVGEVEKLVYELNAVKPPDGQPAYRFSIANNEIDLKAS